MSPSLVANGEGENMDVFEKGGNKIQKGENKAEQKGNRIHFGEKYLSES